LIKDSDFKIVSPNDGISPQEITNLIGKKLSKDVKEDNVVALEDFQD
jgi:sialic acid synthase SpsE